MPVLGIRHGRAGDANALTLLAHRSKAHWGYTAGELAAWRDDLTLTPDMLQHALVLVAEHDQQMVGFATSIGSGTSRTLEHLFVHPSCIGLGVGRALMQCIQAELVRSSVSELLIDADPNAEPFYLALGAVRIDAIAAPVASDPLRVRPLLRLQLNSHRPPASQDPPPTAR